MAKTAKARKDEPRENRSLAVIAKLPRGRPTLYSEALAAEILARIADGETLTRICLDEDMPARSTVSKWLLDMPDFYGRYARARTVQAHHEVDEILDLADDISGDVRVVMTPNGVRAEIDGVAIGRAKVQIETRMWRAERLNRIAYGARVKHEVEPADGPTPAGPAELPASLSFLAGKLSERDAA